MVRYVFMSDARRRPQRGGSMENGGGLNLGRGVLYGTTRSLTTGPEFIYRARNSKSITNQKSRGTK